MHDELSIVNSLQEVVRKGQPDKVFVLTDTNTQRLCWPLLAKSLPQALMICIGASDANKTLESLAEVWQALSNGGASRHSLLINLGGGMVTDLGGFAAATFKRGIPFINIPTTLLAMVDAATGGKTGINFNGLKNEVGAFCNPQAVFFSSTFLTTLDKENLLSGYAEMLKHALLSNRQMLAELLMFNLNDLDSAKMQRMVLESVEVKRRIVEEDPTEQGIRKALNLGHTVGHALESMALAEGHPILHGYGVAWGLVCALYLSVTRLHFSHEVFHQVAQFVKGSYGVFPLNCKQYDRLYELMLHDKKNNGGRLLFTLLEDVGQVSLNNEISKEEIYEMLDFYRES